MGLSTDAYQQMLTALLPPGRLWTIVGGLLSDLFMACADELERLDVRINNLLDEAVPNLANELLPEYESELALVAAPTLAERQANIVARLIARQRFRPSDFQTALASLLALAAGSIVVIERSTALAASMGDVREIYRFFVYRNPTLPGPYFLASAQALITAIQPSHTVGYAIESINFLCDDPYSQCDRDLIGA